MPTPIGRRATTEMLLEDGGEIVRIAEADRIRDLGDRELGVAKQTLRVLDAKLGQILAHALAHLLLKMVTDVRATAIKRAADIVKRNGAGMVAHQVLRDGIAKALFSRRLALTVSQLETTRA